MKVFISWSGEKSMAVAELLNSWLKCVLQAIEPWISTQDIDKGTLWFSEIGGQLRDTSVGIICLTKSNKDKPWILFEAGALAKGLNTAKVCTFLIDLSPTDIESPLSQFNATLPTKDDVRKLVKMLNNSLGDKGLADPILTKVFETYWPQLERELDIIIKSSLDKEVITVKRSNDDVLTEILSITRGLDKRVRSIENTDASISFYRKPIRWSDEEKEKERFQCQKVNEVLQELLLNKCTEEEAKAILEKIGIKESVIDKILIKQSGNEKQ